MAPEKMLRPKIGSVGEGRTSAAWVALGMVMAAWCMVSLTWDGSYYVYCTLQYQRMMIPHHRWINELLLWPGLALSGLYENPAWFARLYGAMFYGVMLTSFVLGMGMLRGKLAPMRHWLVALVLFVPLPGIMCPCSEAFTALFLFALLMAAIWARLCRWTMLPGAVATWLLWGTHPSAALLYGGAAICAGWIALHSTEKVRVKMTLSAGALTICAVAKFLDVIFHASSYEKTQFDPVKLINELLHVSVSTPWLVLPVLMWLLIKTGPTREILGTTASPPKIKMAFVILKLIAIIWMASPLLWSAALNYRKLGAMVAILFALAGTREVIALQNRPGLDGIILDLRAGWLVRLSKIFCLALTLGSLSWTWLCSKLESSFYQSNHVWVMSKEVPTLKQTSLDHWSATTTAYVLQGREPRHVFLGNGTKITPDGVELFSDEVLDFKDGWFHFHELRKMLSRTP